MNGTVMQARAAGFFWMVCVVAGIYGLFPGKGTHSGHDAVIIAGAAYLVVTLLLYVLLKPVNPIVALLSAGFGLVGVATSGDGSFYFGVQCILIGYLVVASTFLPRTLGVLMVVAGVAQLVFFSTLLPSGVFGNLASVGYVADGIGEIALALWLLVFGVWSPQQTVSQPAHSIV